MPVTSIIPAATKYLGTLFFVALLLQSANASGFKWSSARTAANVIELYTSEGCSSCPPADEWISSLPADQLFSEVIPLAFHVDYWDSLGWKDRFALPAYSLRQRDHVRSGNVSQSYTPQLVVNSKEWSSWFRGDRNWRPAERPVVGVLSAEASSQSGELVVRYQPATRLNTQGYVINVAVLGMGLESRVTAGENANRHLKQDFVVLNHKQHRSEPGTSAWKIPPVAIPQRGQKRSALAVWLSAPDSPTIIQAVGGYL